MWRMLCLVAAALALAGCGAVGGSAGVDADSTLLLGAPPAGVHAGIYLAVERGFDEAEGINLTIRRSGDAGQLLGTGQVQAALLKLDQIRAARAVCVMALLQRPAGPYVCVSRTTLEDRRPEVLALVRTLQRGYTETEADPESAVQAILTRAPGLDRATLAAQLDAVSGAFEAGAPAFGSLSQTRIPREARAWFDFSLVGPVSRD